MMWSSRCGVQDVPVVVVVEDDHCLFIIHKQHAGCRHYTLQGCITYRICFMQFQGLVISLGQTSMTYPKCIVILQQLW